MVFSLDGADQVSSLVRLKTHVFVNMTRRIYGGAMFLYVCRNPFLRWCCGVLTIRILCHGGAAEVFQLESFYCIVFRVAIHSHHGAI